MRSLKSESEDLERRAEATQWGGSAKINSTSLWGIAEQVML